MIKVVTFDEFEALIKKVKKRVQKTTSNFFMLKDEIQWYINENRMYYCENEAGICIICDEGDFYHLYYRVNPDIKLQIPKLDKPIMIKFVGHELRKDIKMEKMINVFSRIGFEKHSTTKRLIRHNNETDRDLKNNVNSEIRVRYATENDLKEISRIWKFSLDSLLHPLFELKYMCKLVENNEILCAEDNNGEIIGGLQFEKFNSSIMLWYIAINKNIRSSGIGSLLVKKMIEISMNDGSKNTTVWVVEDNVNAVRFYKRLGYEYDGMYSHQYVFKDKSM